MRRGALAVLSLALLAGAALAQVAPRARLFSRHGGPVTAGSVPGLAGVEPADCEPCHAEIVTAWRRSLHARAYVDPIFRAELEGVEGRAFCVRCHAPRAEEATAEAGVDCATCHVRGGAVLGLSGRGGGAHPVVREPRLASARFCAPCHQFDFPGPEDAPRLRYFPDQRLQATFDEWRASEPARRGETCQRCHMPGASHALRGLDDEAFVAGALSVRASARAEGGTTTLSIGLAPHRVGHAVPTGDVYRRLVVEAEAGGHERTLSLGRTFAPRLIQGHGELLVEVRDTRLRPPGVERALSFPGEASRVRWRVSIVRASDALLRIARLPPEAGRVTVAHGELTP